MSFGAISAPAGDTSKVFDLINLISNPKAYEDKLKALAERESAVKAATDALRAERAAILEDRKAAEAARSLADADLKAAIEIRDQTARDNANASAALKEREDKFAHDVSEFEFAAAALRAAKAEWLSESKIKEAELAEREAALIELEARVAEDAQDAAELKAKWTQKMAAFEAATKALTE